MASTRTIEQQASLASTPPAPQPVPCSLQRSAKVAQLRRETISPSKLACDGAERLLEATGTATRSSWAWGLRVGSEWLYGRPQPSLPRGASFSDRGDWCVLASPQQATSAAEKTVGRGDVEAGTHAPPAMQATLDPQRGRAAPAHRGASAAARVPLAALPPVPAASAKAPAPQAGSIHGAAARAP